MLLYINLASQDTYLVIWVYFIQVFFKLLKTNSIALIHLPIVLEFLLQHLVRQMD